MSKHGGVFLRGTPESGIRAGKAGASTMGRLDELAQFSSSASELTRLYLTPEHKRAALQVMSWMQQAGMTAAIDAVGNVVGRYDGETGKAPSLLIGSHIDTVKNAGKYDGNLGVIVGIQAVAELNARGKRLPFAIEVIAFGDEEGVRFPVTLTGSRAVAGTLDLAALDSQDNEQISIREALQRFGCNPSEIQDVARQRKNVLGYVEVHIEQGPVLESSGLPVGVVTAISGASRFRIQVKGQAGHAGTVPMLLRKDAVAAAAEMIWSIEQLAEQNGELVATVGVLEAMPGAVNVIASAVHFTLDIRSPKDEVRLQAISMVQEKLKSIAARRRVEVSVEQTYDEAAVACAPEMVDGLEAAVMRSSVKPLRLPSGAGHDGLAMSTLCPIGMLFVRCRGGVSHNPAESVISDDVEIAVGIIVDYLQHFDL
jgi:allantoate deiminase